MGINIFLADIIKLNIVGKDHSHSGLGLIISLSIQIKELFEWPAKLTVIIKKLKSATDGTILGRR